MTRANRTRVSTDCGAADARRGFTLVELVVVMVIIAIVGAAVIPALVRPAATDPMSAARPLAEVLLNAHRAAVDSERPVWMTIDPATARYTARMQGSSAMLASGTIPMTGASMLSDSIRASFAFDPTGLARGDSIVVSGGAFPVMVSVNPWTGEPVLRAR